jgi:molybdenum cofactor cytidylyltransferase
MQRVPSEKMKQRPIIIVLAAGHGKRFQGAQHKLAQPLGSTPVLSCTLHQVLASQLPVLVVTTPALAELANQSVAMRDIVVIPADAPGPGMGQSIAAGVAARSNAPGWLVLPGDMPLVSPQTLQAVAAELAHHTVVLAQHQGLHGYPVGFSAELYSELMALKGDQSERRLMARYPAYAVSVNDPGVLLDVNTQADWVANRLEDV